MTAKPRLLEADFLDAVVGLATRRQWQWLHLVRAPYQDRWRTPFRGPLGKGFPDLLLARVKDRRILAVELKRDGNKASDEQIAVLATLEGAGVETHIWRPTDWPMIESALR